MKMDGKHLGKTVEFRFTGGGPIRGKLLKIVSNAADGYMGETSHR